MQNCVIASIEGPYRTRPGTVVEIPPSFDLGKAKMIATPKGLLLVEPNSKPLIIQDGFARELEV